METVLRMIHGAVWGVPALVLILGVGVLLTLRSGFVQLRLFPQALRQFLAQFRGGKDTDGVSPMQALCTALAATVGTGNIAGVAGALALGGPGAIFWMLVCAFLGMVTKMAEATLAVRYRHRENGEYIGGPMYTISIALGKNWQFLAVLYAFFGVVAAFGVGNATQINAVITSIHQAITAFGGKPGRFFNLFMGLALAVPVAAMLLGGAKRIGTAAERLVPFAAAGYMLLCLFVLIARFQAIPNALRDILQGAFTPGAVTGGAVGAMIRTLRVGVSRGVFTNEAGMGTASIAHASANVDHPVRQGLLGIMEVFLDTVVICTMTALVILVSGVPIPYGTDAGAELTGAAIAGVCGDWSAVLIALFLCCFAFATVLGWGLYGIRCAQFLFGHGAWRWFAAMQVVTVVLGAVLETGTVWLLAETVNGLMAIPNLILLIKTTPEFIRLISDYKCKLASNKANGGAYENFYQRQSLRAFSYAEIPPPGGESGESRQKNLPPEYRPAGSGNTAGLL